MLECLSPGLFTIGFVISIAALLIQHYIEQTAFVYLTTTFMLFISLVMFTIAFIPISPGFMVITAFLIVIFLTGHKSSIIESYKEIKHKK